MGKHLDTDQTPGKIYAHLIQAPLAHASQLLTTPTPPWITLTAAVYQGAIQSPPLTQPPPHPSTKKQWVQPGLRRLASSIS